LLTPEQLFSETMALYFEKGARFTMDEVAARLVISKKTLYLKIKRYGLKVED